MKNKILALVAMILIAVTATAQTAGDYRSIANGNWNNATMWEMYNGSSWSTASTYPGQNAGTGAVTIMILHEIVITATIPHPISSLLIDQLNDYSDGSLVSHNGVLTFKAENAVSLAVSGNIVIHGELGIENLPGTKAHTLFVGSYFEIGTPIYDDCSLVDMIPATFQTINMDDKLNVVFTGSTWINSGPTGITFQDVTFDGEGFSVTYPVYIRGTATFVNGIVSIAHWQGYSNCTIGSGFNGDMVFYDGASVRGASHASFVDGWVYKLGDDPFTFPIGDENVYAPLKISSPVSQSASVRAGYQRSNASEIGPITDPGLFNVSNCEYWTVDPGLNNNLDLTVSWSAASGCESSPYITNVSEVTLARFGQGGWSSHSGSGIGTTTNGTVMVSEVNSYGTYTLGNLNACNAPWGNAISIASNSATLSWPAVNGAVSYDVDYKPYTSNEWINASSTSTSLNLTGLSPWTYYDWRIKTHCSSSPSSYKQQQFKTLCGPPSGLVTTNITANSATLSWSAFATSASYNVAYKKATTNTWIPLATNITALTYPLSGLTAGVVYDWRVSVNCTISIQGDYAQSSFTTAVVQPPPTLCNDVYETNNTSQQAKTIIPGTSFAASISSATDVDWFKLTTPNSKTTLQIALSNLPADYDLYLYNKSLTLVASSTVGGTSNEFVTYNSNSRKATYYIKVLGKNGAYNSTQCYHLLAQVASSEASVARPSNPEIEMMNISNNPSLYPNPASEFVVLRFNSDTQGAAILQIQNSTGQLLKQHSVNLTKGYNNVQIRVNYLTPGIYQLRLKNDRQNIIRKFVIGR